MKSIISILLIILSQSAYAEEDWAEKITPEIALKAIQVYKSDPTAKDAVGNLAIATNFAENSDAVTVEIDAKYFPWELGSISQDIESRYIGAFVAGNVEYQLVNRVNKSAPIPSVKLVLFTYRKLLEKNIVQEDEEFENWIHLDQQGKLAKKFGL